MSIWFHFVLLRAAMVLVVLGGLALTACGGDIGPSGAIPRTHPGDWQHDLDRGDFDKVIRDTSEVIRMGEEADFYAEARLYRGVAELKRGKNLDEAQADLTIAENHSDQLTTVNKTQEHVLLYRAQMVIRTKRNDTDAAQAYMNKAIALDPKQTQAIKAEFEQHELQLPSTQK